MTRATLFILLFAVIMLALPQASHAEEEECFKVLSSEWGKFCEGDSESLSITMTNTCEKPWVLSVCMEQKDGHWKCDKVDAFYPKEEKSFGICNSSGNYKFVHCWRAKGCNALELE